MDGELGSAIIVTIIGAVVGAVATALISLLLPANPSQQSLPPLGGGDYIWSTGSSSDIIENPSSDVPKDDESFPRLEYSYLFDMDYFYAERGELLHHDSATDNLGNSHRKVLCDSSYNKVTYKLNGEFASLEGCFFQFEYDKNSDWTTSMEIYLDGTSVCYEEMRGGIEPIDINLNLTNVQELEIEWHSHNMQTYAGLGDCVLYYL